MSSRASDLISRDFLCPMDRDLETFHRYCGRNNASHNQSLAEGKTYQCQIQNKGNKLFPFPPQKPTIAVLGPKTVVFHEIVHFVAQIKIKNVIPHRLGASRRKPCQNSVFAWQSRHYIKIRVWKFRDAVGRIYDVESISSTFLAHDFRVILNIPVLP